MRKQADEERRRLSWLQQEVEHNTESIPITPAKADVYDCNPDVVKGKTGRMPNGWSKAVQTASWLHIDEIRTLLELHYGELKRKLSPKLCLS